MRNIKTDVVHDAFFQYVLLFGTYAKTYYLGAIIYKINCLPTSVQLMLVAVETSFLIAPFSESKFHSKMMTVT